MRYQHGKPKSKDKRTRENNERERKKSETKKEICGAKTKTKRGNIITKRERECVCSLTQHTPRAHHNAAHWAAVLYGDGNLPATSPVLRRFSSSLTFSFLWVFFNICFLCCVNNEVRAVALSVQLRSPINAEEHRETEKRWKGDSTNHARADPVKGPFPPHVRGAVELERLHDCACGARQWRERRRHTCADAWWTQLVFSVS